MEKKPKKRVVRIKTIFERLENYNEEEVLEAISRLRKEEQELLYKAYGNDLKEKDRYSFLSDEEKQLINNIVNQKIKTRIINQNLRDSRIGKIRLPKTPFEKFKDYKKEEVLDGISRLTEKDQELLKKAYGINFDEKELFSKLSDKEKEKVKRIMSKTLPLRMKNKEIKPKTKTIFDYYQDVSKETILAAFDRLDEEEKQHLIKAYGEYLDDKSLYQKLTSKEKEKVRYIIIRKLKSRINNRRKIRNLFEYFPTKSEQEVLEAFYKLPIISQELLKKAYGNDLKQNDIFQTLNSETKSQVYNTINHQLKNLVNINSPKTRNVKNILERFPNKSIKEIEEAFSKLTEKEQKLLKKSFGEKLNDSSQYYNLTKEEKTKVKSIIEKLKGNLYPNAKKQSNSRKKIEDNNSARNNNHKKIKKSNKSEKVMMSKSSIQNIIDKTEYKKLSREEERIIIKKAKLSYYYDVTEEKEEYLDYYKEVFPSFKTIYETASDSEKELLLKKAIENSKYWRDKFLENNQRLVISIAKRYRYDSTIEDLVIEGNIGLMKALRKFDLSKNTKFSTYASLWIKQSITRYLKEKERTIRLPVYMEDKIYFFKTKIELFTSENRRYPNIEEIMNITGFSKKEIEEIKRVQELVINPKSLNIKLKDDSEAELESFVTSEDDSYKTVEDKLYNEKLIKIIESSGLDKQTLGILMMRYGLKSSAPKNYSEIGKYYKLSINRVRQIEKAGIEKLRMNYKLRSFYSTEQPSLPKKEIDILRKLKEIIEKNEFTQEEISILNMFYIEKKSVKEIEDIIQISKEEIEKIRNKFIKMI